MRFTLAFLLLAGVSARDASSDQVTPVQKVLQMMDELKAKGVAEMQAEQETFATFSKWCHTTEIDKTKSISNAKLKIEQLSADIGKWTQDSAVLAEQIAELDGTIDKSEQEIADAKKARKADHELFQQKLADYDNSIDQVDEGVKQLKLMMSSTEGAAGAAAFIQQFAGTARLQEHSRQALRSFLETSDTIAAPEAAAFESKSGGVVDMMEKMGLKLVDEKKKCEEEEAEAVHANMKIQQSFTSEINKSQDVRSRRAANMHKKQEAASDAKADLASTSATKSSDESYLADLQTECAQKHEDFEARQKLRQEELDAIDKAKDIIAGGAVSGAADKHLPGLVQVSFAQLRSVNAAAKPAVLACAAYLNRQGKKMNSSMLAALAIRVSEDPFGKVKKLIEGMIGKLMTEATDEADQKGFCDTEMGTNKMTREKKTATVESLSANIEEMTAKTGQLTEEVAELSEDIASIDAALAKATEIRTQEKAKNAQTISEAQQAISAVQKAIDVLKEFYAKAAGATAFSQFMTNGVSDEAPETFDKPFTGSGGEGGIVGMLEVILSDFQRLEAETTQGEADGEREFVQLQADSSQDKAVKGTQSKQKSEEIARLGADTSDAKQDLASNQEELDAAMKYFEKLKPTCMTVGASYEDRVARRKAEIESLHEALKILSDENNIR